jgi:hypothetical protein
MWDAADNHRWINTIYDKFDNDIDLVAEMIGLSAPDIKAKLISFRLREFAVKKSLLTEAEINAMTEENFPWSSLDRILSYASIKEDLGLEFEDNKLTSNKSPEFFSGYVKEIFSGVVLGTNDKEAPNSIHSRTNKDQADTIAESIKKRITLTESGKGTSVYPLNDQPVKAAPQPPLPSGGAKKSKRAKGNGALANGYEITSSNNKIRGLFYSLQKIAYKSHPVAVTLIMRCLLELSIRDFIDGKSLRGNFIQFCEARNKNKGEAPSLDNAVLFLKSLGKEHIDKTVLESFDLYKDPRSLIGSKSINLVTHGKTHALPPEEIKKFWDHAGVPIFSELISMVQSD